MLDNLIKRSLLGYGEPIISQKEFIVWCAAGSEDPSPLYHHRAGLQAVDSILSAAVLISTLATPSPSQQIEDFNSSPSAVRTPLSIVRESEAGSPILPPTAAVKQQQPSPPVVNTPQQQSPSPTPVVIPQPVQPSPPAVVSPQQQVINQPSSVPAPQPPVAASVMVSKEQQPSVSPKETSIPSPVELPPEAPEVVEEVQPTVSDGKSQFPPAELKIEEVASPQPGVAWVCNFCDTENEADAAICEICETKSPH